MRESDHEIDEVKYLETGTHTGGDDSEAEELLLCGIGGRETAAFRRGGALPLIADACVGLRVGVFNLICLL